MAAIFSSLLRVTVGRIYPIAAGYKDCWTLTLDIAADLLANQNAAGPNWIADVEAGRTSFAEDKIHFKDILKRYGERLSYVNMKPFETDWNQAQGLLAEGKAGMIINGTWTVDGVKSKNPSINLGLFAFPYSNHSQNLITDEEFSEIDLLNKKSFK